MHRLQKKMGASEALLDKKDDLLVQPQQDQPGASRGTKPGLAQRRWGQNIVPSLLLCPVSHDGPEGTPVLQCRYD